MPCACCERPPTPSSAKGGGRLLTDMIREAGPLTPGNPFDVRTLEGSRLRWLVHPKPAAEPLAGLAGF